MYECRPRSSWRVWRVFFLSAKMMRVQNFSQTLLCVFFFFGRSVNSRQLRDVTAVINKQIDRSFTPFFIFWSVVPPQARFLIQIPGLWFTALSGFNNAGVFTGGSPPASGSVSPTPPPEEGPASSRRCRKTGPGQEALTVREREGEQLSRVQRGGVRKRKWRSRRNQGKSFFFSSRWEHKRAY